jgi:hypothetical protein
MTVQVRLSTRQPEEGLNGLDDMREELCANDHDAVWVVARVRTLKVVTESEKGGVTVPTVRLLQVEPMTGDRADAVAKLYQDARAARTGQQALPVEFTDDPETGEIRKVERSGAPDVWLDPAARDDDQADDDPVVAGDDEPDEPRPRVPSVDFSGDASIPVPGDEAAAEPAVAEPDDDGDTRSWPNDAEVNLRYGIHEWELTGPPELGGPHYLPLDEDDGPDPAGAKQWGAQHVAAAGGPAVLRWDEAADGEYRAVLDELAGPAPAPPAATDTADVDEHEGATEDWADEMRQMRVDMNREDGKDICAHCHTTIEPRDGLFVDSEGFPARDGHQHTPAAAADQPAGDPA